MNLRKIEQFDSNSLNRGQCALANRPKTLDEEFAVGTSVMIDDSVAGEIQLSIAAIQELAAFIGYEDPAKLKEEMAIVVNTLLTLTGEKETLEIENRAMIGQVTRLAADLDTAEATKVDAVEQFQAAERTIKELELQVDALDTELREKTEALETAEQLLEDAE